MEELDEFDLKVDEFDEIEQEHKRLANGTELIATCQASLDLLTDGEENNIESLLNRVVSLAEDLQSYDPALSNVSTMLNDALIQVQESAGELQHYLSKLELDPTHFAYLEERLSKAMQLARKHHVSPNKLAEHHLALKAELSSLDSDESKLEEVQQQVEASRAAYLSNAQSSAKAVLVTPRNSTNW